jgi:UDP-2,3-diacylglucosamine pyrophosphatase LpxH
VAVAVKVMRQCIESALEKHKRVHVINLPGNHDETGALWMSIALGNVYEREPRVTIERSPSLFAYDRWGKVLLGAHHGHACRVEKLAGVMACDRAQEWGETTHRHWLIGHIHHESKREFSGVTVESFNTLAAKDAYAANGGWRSGRSMQALVFHKEHGEVARAKVHAAMYEKAAA